MPYFLRINGEGVASVVTDAEIVQQLRHMADDDSRPVLEQFLTAGKEGDFYVYNNHEMPLARAHYVRLGRRFFDDRRRGKVPT